MAAALCLSACNFIRYTGDVSLTGAKALKSSGTFLTKSYDAADFAEINISVPAKIIYTSGAPLVEINAPDNYLELISVSNNAGVLEISMDAKHSDDEITVTVRSSQLNSLTVKGAADFSAPEGIVSEKDFSTTISGAAELEISSLKASAVDLDISGAADLDISGIDCSSLDISVSGAGNGRLAGTVSGHAAVTLSGAGHMDLRDLTAASLSPTVKGVGVIRTGE